MHSDRQRWIFAAAAALILGLGALALFRPPLPVAIESVKPKAKAGVGLAKVVKGEAALLDKTPLFLPTEWNTAQKQVALPEVGGAFADYPPKFAYDEAELKSLKPTAVASLAAADALALTPPGPASLGFGRSEANVEALPKRGAFMEIVQAGSGRRVLAKALGQASPPTLAVWAPLEFLATVEAAGLSGPLVVTVRSGVEEVDAYFQEYLAQKVRIGAIMTPGLYRISVGP